MSKLRVHSFAISIDGFGTEDDIAAQGLTGFGAWILGLVNDGIDAALERAKAAAGGLDVRLGGGVATIRQYLKARLVDDLHLVISPVLLGNGEHLLHGIDMRALGYECARHVAGSRAAAHVFHPQARVRASITP